MIARLKPLSPSSLWLWLPPLAVGAAAFLWPVEKSQPPETSASHGDRNTIARRSDGRAMLAEVHAALEERRQKAAEQESDRLDHLNGADRRALLLELRVKLTAMKKKGEATFWCGGASPEEEAAGKLESGLVQEEGLDGLRWLEENWPERLESIVDGMVEGEPELAFDYLVSAQRMNPCSTEAVMKLLATRAGNGGAEALLDSVKRMPWPLFDEGLTRFELPGDIDPVLWVSSGASVYLHEQGVAVDEVLPRLAPVAPDLAVREWLANPKNELGLVDPDPLIKAMRESPEVEATMLATFRDAGPEGLDTLRDALRKTFLDNGGDFGHRPDDEGLARWRAALFPGEEWKPQDDEPPAEEEPQAEPASDPEEKP